MAKYAKQQQFNLRSLLTEQDLLFPARGVQSGGKKKRGRIIRTQWFVTARPQDDHYNIDAFILNMATNVVAILAANLAKTSEINQQVRKKEPRSRNENNSSSSQLFLLSANNDDLERFCHMVFLVRQDI